MKKHFFFVLIISGSFFLLSQSISITYPKQGTQVCKGETLTITWTRSGHENSMVRIGLLRGGSRVLQIARTTNSGSYQWHVPESLTNGSYTMGIRVVNTHIQDVTDPFPILHCLSVKNPSTTNHPVTQDPSTQPRQHGQANSLAQTPDFSLKNIQYNIHSNELEFEVQQRYYPYQNRVDVSIKCQKLQIEDILSNIPVGAKIKFPLSWPDTSCKLLFDIMIDPEKKKVERNRNNNRFRGNIYRSTSPYYFIAPAKITIITKLNKRLTVKHGNMVELKRQWFDYDPMYKHVYLDLLFDIKQCSKESRKTVWAIKETDGLLKGRIPIKPPPIPNLAFFPARIRVVVKAQESNYLILWVTHNLQKTRYREVKINIKFRDL